MVKCFNKLLCDSLIVFGMWMRIQLITHIMFYDQVLSEAFVRAFFLREMQRFWGQEPL